MPSNPTSVTRLLALHAWAEEANRDCGCDHCHDCQLLAEVSWLEDTIADVYRSLQPPEEESPCVTPRASGPAVRP